ncbi:MAG: phosphodiester glycosidase family protein, partial [Treponema sp.]|nr:phosphodiester glycosidase family protein [Treponema sp.]
REKQEGPRSARSAAGLSGGGKILYLLAIDGKRPGSPGATEAETALILKRLGAAEGINLDGGGSSALALRFPGGETRLVNTPVHQIIPGRERAVAVCLGIGVE